MSRLISDAFVFATFGTWTEIFYKAMEAYKGQPELLFIPDLYDYHMLYGGPVFPDVPFEFERD